VLFESLPSLPVGDAWVWSPGWPSVDGIFQRVHVDPIETFDSGATPKVGQRITPPKSVADVDIGALKDLFASSIARAKADDPRELRKRIAQLERLLDGEARRQLQPVVEVLTERVEVPVLSQEQFDNLARIANDAAQHAAWMASSADQLLEASGLILRALTSGNSDKPPSSEVERRPVPRIIPVPASHKRPATANAPAPRPERQAADEAKLGKGERKVLTVLAQNPDGRTYNELAFLAEYSTKASTLGVVLSKLRRLGYVTSGGNPMITDAGRVAIGPVEALPSGPELLEYWRHHPRIGAGERKVLDVLIARFPSDISHDELCELAGYSPNASTVGVILSKLRKLGLVATDSRRVAPEFMEAIR
jgi:uncharacterized protein